jgi:transcriptional regulator with XRE-family HTH domain
MNASRKGVTSEQLRQAAKDLNLTVAAIAEGTGLSKAYISEFRNETRNLSISQQAQLRTYLEAQYEAQDLEFPDAQAKEAEKEPGDDAKLLQGLGGLVNRVSRPAILLSDDIPKAQADKLLDLVEANRLKVADLLAGDFQTGGFLGGEFSDATENAIREIFALLALNYVAILMLQGRNIARKVPTDYTPKTMGDWLSRHLAQSSLADLLPTSEHSETETEDV